MTRAEERSLDLGGLRVHVRVAGDGPPLLLINGLGAHTAMWRCVESALEGFRVIEFDAPGTGRSETPLVPVSISRLARMATQVLDAFGVGRADVLGYSMGGMIAQQLAVDAPERVRRIVLAATTCGLGGLQGDPLAMLNIATPVRYLSPRLYAMTIGSLAGGRARYDPDWVRSHGALRLRHAPTMRGYVGQLVSLTGWTSLRLLPRIHHPTLVVAGDDDPLAPVANAKLLAHCLPRAKLVVAEGEGHLLLMDVDSRVHGPIREFLLAGSLDDAPVWRDTEPVDEEELRRSISATPQFPPWRAFGSLVRRMLLEAPPRDGGEASDADRVPSSAREAPSGV